MEWKDEVPTKPGLYLCWGEEAVDLVKVYKDGPMVIKAGAWERLERIDIDPAWQWCGPIKTPEP